MNAKSHTGAVGANCSNSLLYAIRVDIRMAQHLSLSAQFGSIESVLRAHAAQKSAAPLQNHRCIAERNAIIQADCSKSKTMLATAVSINTQWRNFPSPTFRLCQSR
ncbi:MAG: hypothetical protein ACI901_002007 [Octadecabacter sp.]|jgi:hypothetical protein